MCPLGQRNEINATALAYGQDLTESRSSYVIWKCIWGSLLRVLFVVRCSGRLPWGPEARWSGN
jgi:hypothetical protein